MTKYKYLKELERILSQHMTKTEAEDIVDYYDAYLSEGVEYGKTEKEVMEELGVPEQLAHSILQEMDINVKKEDPVVNAYEKVKDFIKQPKMPSVFKREHSYNDEEMIEIELDNYKCIDDMLIDIISGNVLIAFANISKPIIKVSGPNAASYFKYDPEDYELVFKQGKSNKYFNILEDSHYNIDMVLPLDCGISDLVIKTVNAKIEIRGNGIDEDTDVNINCVNKQLIIRDFNGSDLKINHVNGKIDLDRVYFEDIHINTVDSDVDILYSDRDFKVDVKFTTVSGQINAFNQQSSGLFSNLKRTFGNVNAHDSIDLKVNNVNGLVTIDKEN